MLISIVVPVYNEQEALVELSQGVRQELTRLGQPWEIIFINDGSTDNSAVILDQLADSDRRIRVIHFKRNSGQTAAMMAGFDFAQGDVIIPLDGDGQNDPADIPRMLNLIDQGFDVVSGWRKDRQDNVIQRNIPSILANRLISAVSGVRLHDFGCSLKAYKRKVVDGVRLYGEMHRFLPIYTSWHGAKIAELVVNHRPRRTGESKYGFERVFKVLLDLLVVKFLDRFANKPMYLFGGCALWWLCRIQLGGKRHRLPMHALSQNLPGYFLHHDAITADGGNDIHDRDDVYSAWSLGRDDHADLLRIAR